MGLQAYYLVKRLYTWKQAPETGLNVPKAVTQVSYGAQVQDTGTEIKS